MKRILILFSLFFSVSAAAAQTVEVWKDPSCGCCTGWVEHLRASGFQVQVHDVTNLDEARRRNGVPASLAACHTARVDGYAVEGHVPASDVRRLLREKPRAAGIAVPGMPAGSPGMEAPARTPYQSLLFAADGGTRVWASHAPNAHLAQIDRAPAALAEGVVRKVDKDAKKITIKHGPLANLDMPAMTMVFQVRDPAMLEQVKAGDTVRFEAQKVGGAFIVTAIEPAQ